MKEFMRTVRLLLQPRQRDVELSLPKLQPGHADPAGPLLLPFAVPRAVVHPLAVLALVPQRPGPLDWLAHPLVRDVDPLGQHHPLVRREPRRPTRTTHLLPPFQSPKPAHLREGVEEQPLQRREFKIPQVRPRALKFLRRVEPAARPIPPPRQQWLVLHKVLEPHQRPKPLPFLPGPQELPGGLNPLPPPRHLPLPTAWPTGLPFQLVTGKHRTEPFLPLGQRDDVRQPIVREPMELLE